MESNNKEINAKNNYDYLKIYESLLDKYGLSDNCICIITGLGLVGIENTEFWLNFVNIIEKIYGLDALQFYVTQMCQMPRENLLHFLNNIYNPVLFKTNEDAYIAFINLLSQVSKEESFTK